MLLLRVREAYEGVGVCSKPRSPGSIGLKGVGDDRSSLLTPLFIPIIIVDQEAKGLFRTFRFSSICRCIGDDTSDRSYDGNLQL